MMEMKKKLFFISISIILLALVFSGCTDNNNNSDNGGTDSALDGLSYINTDYTPNFGMNYPDGWTVNENDQFGPVRFYGDTINGFQVNLGITEPIPLDGETLTSVASQMEEGYPEMFTNYTYVSSKTFTINGMDSYELIYTFSQGNYDVKGKQVLIEKNEVVYFLTFTAGVDSFNDYIDVVDDSISSFKIA